MPKSPWSAEKMEAAWETVEERARMRRAVDFMVLKEFKLGRAGVCGVR
jgi:hypothetical protein